MSRMISRAALAVAITAVLASCDSNMPGSRPGTSAGAGVGTGVDTSTQRDQSTDHKESVDQRISAAIKVPAWALFIEMAQELDRDNEPSHNAFDESWHLKAWEAVGADAVEAVRREFWRVAIEPVWWQRIEAKPAWADYRQHPVYHEAALNYWAAELSAVTAGVSRLNRLIATAQCTDGMGWIGTGDSSYDLLIREGGACGQAMGLADMAVKRSRGQMGWPADLISTDERADWARRFVPQVELVNRIAADVVGHVISRPVPNPDAAKSAMRARLVELAKADAIKATWEGVQDEQWGHLSINMTGKQRWDPEFNIEGRVYGRDQSGWHAIRHGMPWFGEGRLMGQEYHIAMDSTLSNSASRGLSARSARGATARTETNAKSDLK